MSTDPRRGLTEDGTEKAERLLESAGLLTGTNLYDYENTQVVHHLNQALRAIIIFRRDTDYIVRDGKVIIIDEFTGRMMDGRRWSNGLHQAVEAKEGVPIQSENQTLASITFQNYFRLYGKLSGMTGTADTEAYEFQEIYGLETVVIPPNKPTIRKDELDLVYKTAKEKYDAVTEDIRDCHQRGQPTLVGTTSIENSELLSSLLDKEKLPHQVLNAKQHAREAEIVAQELRKRAHFSLDAHLRKLAAAVKMKAVLQHPRHLPRSRRNACDGHERMTVNFQHFVRAIIHDRVPRRRTPIARDENAVCIFECEDRGRVRGHQRCVRVNIRRLWIKALSLEQRGKIRSACVRE